MAKSNETWKPQWVALPILDFARIVHSFGNDAESLGQWTKKFAEDLLFCNTDTSNEFVKTLLEESSDKYEKKSKAGRKGGNAKARNRKNSGSAMPADKREQGEDNTADIVSGDGPEPDNLSGDVSRREADDGESDGNVVAACTTVSDHFEVRQGQTGAGAPSVREKCCHDAHAPHGPRRVKPKAPKNAAEVVAWAADHGIDEVDARDWYELNFVVRPGCDKDGCVIENWPGHCISYCRAVKEKRESA